MLLLVIASPAALAATIMVYGDSLSAGYGLPQDRGWVSLLKRRLHDERGDYRVINASVSGETTLGGKKRIEAALRAHRPAIVVLELGANDGLRGQNLDAMRDNLDAMVLACRKSGAAVLLVGMRLPPNYGAAYAKKFHTVFEEIARRRKLAFVPFLFEGFADNRELFQADGIHPGENAQSKMLDTVWGALRPLLSR